MLQLVGFLAVEPPNLEHEEGIRDEQLRVFREIRPLAADCLVRGQLRGYRAEENVAPDSTVEAFAAVGPPIDPWRLEGMPFLIRAGKPIATIATKAIVSFKRPPVMMPAHGETNYVHLNLNPAMEIAIGARVKRRGEKVVSEPIELQVTHRPSGDEMTPYERVLDDAVPAPECEPGSWGTAAAMKRAADIGGWHDPAA